MPGTIWTCTIGSSEHVPPGGDLPMRMAVENAFFALTAEWPEFIFSGWGGELNPTQQELVDNARERERLLNAA